MSLKIKKEDLQEKVKSVVEKNSASLYELNFNYEFDNDVIQVLVEAKQNESVSFELLSRINEAISNLLDQIPELDEKYVLEVSSAGIERQIKDQGILLNGQNIYVYVEYQKESGSGSFTGEFVKCVGDEFFFTYFDKGQPKKISLTWPEIKFIRYAINFKKIEN